MAFRILWRIAHRDDLKHSIKSIVRISLLSQKVFASFNSRLRGDSLPDLAISLLKVQKSKWRQLADGYESLNSVKVRKNLL